MKKLNKSTVAIFSIVSTILSYPAWILPFITNYFPKTGGAILIYINFIVIFIALLFGCRALYRLYRRADNDRTARWGQIGFIFLVSFTIKFVINAAFFFSGIILALMIPYGVDIIFIAPIAIVVNLLIATTPVRKPDKCAKAN